MPADPVDGENAFDDPSSHGTPADLHVAPPAAVVRRLAATLATGETDGGVRLLVTPAGASAAFDDFLAATAAAEAVAAGRLAVRVDDGLEESLTLAGDELRVHVRADGRADTVRSADGPLVEAVRRTYDRRWREAAPYSFDVPARTRLLETFRDRFPAAGETFAAALEGADALPRSAPLDPVGVCTLAAARHGLLSQDVGEWAREVGFSSRTEVARAKDRLTDAGLVDTERVHHGVGRPRQRLVLADESLSTVDATDLVAAARERAGLLTSA